MKQSTQVYPVGQVTDFQSGQIYPLCVASRNILLVRKDDFFFAVRDACPHQGARLSAGELTGNVVATLPGQSISLERIGYFLSCPWHGWKFDLKTGCSVLEPSQFRIKSYIVHVEEQQVFINLSSTPD